jgi:hypothetical protein
MNHEAYARAVLAERARERDVMMRHRQLLAAEPAPAPRPRRGHVFFVARRLRRAAAY